MHTVVAHLNTVVGPVERYDLFEEPLDKALAGAEAGDVSGGGSLMADDGAIVHVDVEITLPELTDPVLDLIVDTLNGCGAPRGSWLHDGSAENRLRDVGLCDLLALPLDGQGLPDAVYEAFDFEDFLKQALTALGDAGQYGGTVEGARYTTLYFAGRAYDLMAERLKPLVDRAPICAGTTLMQAV